jgi:hypothetical protein
MAPFSFILLSADLSCHSCVSDGGSLGESGSFSDGGPSFRLYIGNLVAREALETSNPQPSGGHKIGFYDGKGIDSDGSPTLPKTPVKNEEIPCP